MSTPGATDIATLREVAPGAGEGCGQVPSSLPGCWVPVASETGGGVLTGPLHCQQSCSGSGSFVANVAIAAGNNSKEERELLLAKLSVVIPL